MKDFREWITNYMSWNWGEDQKGLVKILYEEDRGDVIIELQKIEDPVSLDDIRVILLDTRILTGADDYPHRIIGTLIDCDEIILKEAEEHGLGVAELLICFLVSGFEMGHWDIVSDPSTKIQFSDLEGWKGNRIWYEIGGILDTFFSVKEQVVTAVGELQPVQV